MRVGVLGAGVMARGMVLNLVRAGHTVRVYNRTPERLTPLVAAGASAAATPADAAAQAEAVLSCVTDRDAVERVWLGPAGAASTLAPEALALDLSTIGPEAARALARALGREASGFCDAPVTGGEAGAAAGTLTVFVGGAPDDVARARPLFDAIARVVHHVGGVGSGQAVKLVQNLVGGLNLLAAAEGAALAEAYGLGGAKVLGLLGETTSQSRAAEILLERLESGRHEPGFSVDNRLKDFRLALAMAHAENVPLPVTAAGAERMAEAAARGLGGLDQTAVWRIVAPASERD